MDSYVPNIQLGIYKNLSILIFLIFPGLWEEPSLSAADACRGRRWSKKVGQSQIFKSGVRNLSFEGILHQIIMITIILIRWQEEQDAEQRRKDAMKLGDEERETILQVHVVIIPKSTVVNQVLNSSSYSTRHIRVNLLVDQNQRGRCWVTSKLKLNLLFTT